LNNGEAMRDAAIAGLGLVALPQFIVAPALAKGELIAALPDAHPVPDTIYAIYPQTQHLSRKVRVIINRLVVVLGGEPPPWGRERKQTKSQAR